MSDHADTTQAPADDTVLIASLTPAAPADLVPVHTGDIATRNSSITDDAALLRAFEPVIKLTKGESFFPVSVSAYVGNAALWVSNPDADATIEAEPGTLDLDTLAALGSAHAGPGQSLSLVSIGRKIPLRERLFRRDRRARLKGGSRLAEVGLLGRTIDSASRLSLIFRGSMPGGSASASFRMQNELLDPDTPTYYGRVVRDGGYIICQYWFFYAFNNWRSGFGGVNEHEADWEQVTIYLDGSGEVDGAGLPHPRWVVFSAHDETGDDLRRRWDDPDLSLVGGRHPVVFAGAGSHSGAYLAGDYLITIEPPNLGGLVSGARKVVRVLTPWSTNTRGVGIPYIDYARGDGMKIGPSQQYSWQQVVIDDDTDWVYHFRGLWGHDTKDRLGGERGPAGPRYERDSSVRASWADPVGWAGLSKVPPNPAQAEEFVDRRIAEINGELADIDEAVSVGRTELRTTTAGLDPGSPEVRALAKREAELLKMQQTRTRLADERARLREAQRTSPPVPDVHAHLGHRNTPIAPANRKRSRMLSVWAILSTPLILFVLSRLVLPTGQSRTMVVIVALAALLTIEAMARGYLLTFLSRAALVVGAGVLLYYGYRDWQEVLATILALTGLAVLLVNLRDAWWR